jgi:hypothetical protein
LAGRALRSFPLQCLVLAAAFWAYHAALRSWLAATGGPLGALRARHFVPLLATPDPRWTLWLIPAVVVVAAFLATARRVYGGWRTGPMLAASYLWFVAIGLAVSMIDGYRATPDGGSIPAFMHPYSDPVFEYYNDVPLVEEKGPLAVLRKWSHWEFRDKLHIRSLTLVPLLCGVLTLGIALRDRMRLPAAVRALVVGGLTVVALFALLHVATGYDPIRAVKASYRYDEDLMGSGYENPARVARQSVAQIVAWLFVAGIPITLLWVKDVLSAARRPSPDGLLTLAYAASLFLIGFSTLYSMETERIWLFMAPFIAAAAGRRLVATGAPPLALVGALTGAQVLLFEVRLRTAW